MCTKGEYVCADCGNHQDSMEIPCTQCGLRRVVLVSFIKLLLGENYMEAFAPEVEVNQ